jgi:hypothetical protein
MAATRLSAGHGMHGQRVAVYCISERYAGYGTMDGLM